MLGYLGLCWRLSGPKKNPEVGFFFGSVLGLCWAIWRLCWASVGPFEGYVGPLLGHLGFCWRLSGRKKYPQPKIFRLGVILGRFWAYVGPFGGYVGPLLGHFRAMFGCWRLSGLKFQPQRKHGSVEVEFWIGFGLKIGSKRVAPSTFSF